MKTISDTDFAGDGDAVPYRGAEFARSGKAGDMTEEPKRESDVSTRFRPDRRIEEFKAPVIA